MSTTGHFSISSVLEWLSSQSMFLHFFTFTYFRTGFQDGLKSVCTMTEKIVSQWSSLLKMLFAQRCMDNHWRLRGRRDGICRGSCTGPFKGLW